MKRDLPVMIFKKQNGTTVCRACYNKSSSQETVIRFCSSMFLRTCDKHARITFNNREHKILMLIDGFCDIRSSTINGNCHMDMQCIGCLIKDNAIQLYKQNNNFQ